MSGQAAWEFSKDILAKRFAGVRAPLFYGNSLTAGDQTYLRGKPRPYLLAAIDLLKKLGGRTIVEIGCMRQPMPHTLEQFNPVCCNDGHSTMFWGSSGLAVYTVDISQACCDVTKAACQGYPNVHVSCGDGVEYLRRFSTETGTIDLLFLDAWDAVEGIPYAEKHLEAYEAAREKLSPRAIVQIDDTDIAFGGKGRLVTPAIIRDGFELLLTGRQTMLLRTA
jgi:hypothetical protein